MIPRDRYEDARRQADGLPAIERPAREISRGQSTLLIILAIAAITGVFWNLYTTHEEQAAVKNMDYSRCYSSKCEAAVAVRRMGGDADYFFR
ncbi:MAG TPA: hypothetical protein VF631_09180 [Allosphingosinicella sp.]|jgi:lipopolysaccharide export system protein LptC|uniref:hypothetical protein n=1 Tax=Allosphingosinicella sp. TaxID=2823234 RepID=UPI002F284EAB